MDSNQDGQSFTEYKRICCRDIHPNLNKKEILHRHFLRFGEVASVRIKSHNSAIIKFNSAESAAMAKKHGKVVTNLYPPMNIFFCRTSDTLKNKEIDQERLSLIQLDEYQMVERPKELHEQHIMHSKPKPKLKTKKLTNLSKSSPSEKKKSTFQNKNLEETQKDLNEKTNTAASPIQNQEDNFIQKSSIENSDKLDKSHQKTSKSSSENVEQVEQSFLAIINQPAHTSDERYHVLHVRDLLIRQKGEQEKKSKKKKKLSGYCIDMCPEKERYSRISKHRLSLLETPQILQSKAAEKTEHFYMIKEYSRSSADQQEPLLHELRPSQILKLTMDYLICNIMDKEIDDNVSVQEWYNFIWDRTRSIRKDITQQQLCDKDSVEIIEKCIRFHIHCAEALSEYDSAIFDPKINNENLNKSLQTLKYMYHDLLSKGKRCPNEAEFRAYEILLGLTEGETLRIMKDLKIEVLKSPLVKFAHQALLAFSSNNYVKFFKLIENATYLNSCILHRYVYQARIRAIQVIVRAYTTLNQTTLYPIENIVKNLKFESPKEAQLFCSLLGLTFDEDYVILDKKAFKLPSSIPPFLRCPMLVSNKKKTSIGEIINNGPLPQNPLLKYKPHNSFDENGFLNKEALNALDQYKLCHYNLEQSDEKICKIKEVIKNPSQENNKSFGQFIVTTASSTISDKKKDYYEESLLSPNANKLFPHSKIQIQNEISNKTTSNITTNSCLNFFGIPTNTTINFSGFPTSSSINFSAIPTKPNVNFSHIPTNSNTNLSLINSNIKPLINETSIITSNKLSLPTTKLEEEKEKKEVKTFMPALSSHVEEKPLNEIKNHTSITTKSPQLFLPNTTFAAQLSSTIISENNDITSKESNISKFHSSEVIPPFKTNLFTTLKENEFSEIDKNEDILYSSDEDIATSEKSIPKNDVEESQMQNLSSSDEESDKFTDDIDIEAQEEILVQILDEISFDILHEVIINEFDEYESNKHKERKQELVTKALFKWHIYCMKRKQARRFEAIETWSPLLLPFDPNEYETNDYCSTPIAVYKEQNKLSKIEANRLKQKQEKDLAWECLNFTKLLQHVHCDPNFASTYLKNTNIKIFFKLLLIFPMTNDEELSLYIKWIQAKFTLSQVKELPDGSKLLTFYKMDADRIMISVRAITLGNLNVNFMAQNGSLNGISGMILCVPVNFQDSKVFSSFLKQLNIVLSSRGKFPTFPLLILLLESKHKFNVIDLLEYYIKEEQYVGEFTNIKMVYLSAFHKFNENSEELLGGVTWLMKNKVEFPLIISQPFSDYIDDSIYLCINTLSKKFSMDNFKHLAEFPTFIINFINALLKIKANFLSSSYFEELTTFWPPEELKVVYPEFEFLDMEFQKKCTQNMKEMLLPEFHDNYTDEEKVWNYVAKITKNSKIDTTMLIISIKRILEVNEITFHDLSIPWLQIISECIFHQSNNQILQFMVLEKNSNVCYIKDDSNIIDVETLWKASVTDFEKYDEKKLTSQPLKRKFEMIYENFMPDKYVPESSYSINLHTTQEILPPKKQNFKGNSLLFENKIQEFAYDLEDSSNISDNSQYSIPSEYVEETSDQEKNKRIEDLRASLLAAIEKEKSDAEHFHSMLDQTINEISFTNNFTPECLEDTSGFEKTSDEKSKTSLLKVIEREKKDSRNFHSMLDKSIEENSFRNYSKENFTLSSHGSTFKNIEEQISLLHDNLKMQRTADKVIDEKIKILCTVDK